MPSSLMLTSWWLHSYFWNILSMPVHATPVYLRLSHAPKLAYV